MMSQDGLSVLPSSIRGFAQEPQNSNSNPNPNANPVKRKRNLPGQPDPGAEVIALSPKSLMATNRFVCEICKKGFQRDQNLQLHRRGHNLPWKLKQRTSKEVIKKVYICPEKTCIHHDPSRALGDLTGIKKHFSRKHGEKKWKCEKCCKKYAVQSDWKAHSKICGTREYKCDCGTLFSRKDSFITHRAFCDALAEENGRFPPAHSTLKSDFMNGTINNGQASGIPQFSFRSGLAGLDNFNADSQKPRLALWLDHANNSHQLNPIGGAANNSNANYLASSSTSLPELSPTNQLFGSSQWLNPSSTLAFPRGLKQEEDNYKGNFSETSVGLFSTTTQNHQPSLDYHNMSATALLQKASQMGSTRSSPARFPDASGSAVGMMSSPLSHRANSYAQNRNEMHKFFGQAVNHEGDQNLNDLMNSLTASTTTTTSTIGEDGGGILMLGQMDSNSVMGGGAKNLNHLVMKPSGKQNQGAAGSNEAHELSLTRDFLGVGGDQHPDRPFLPQELAKFASFDFIQYNGNS